MVHISRLNIDEAYSMISFNKLSRGEVKNKGISELLSNELHEDFNCWYPRFCMGNIGEREMWRMTESA